MHSNIRLFDKKAISYLLSIVSLLFYHCNPPQKENSLTAKYPYHQNNKKTIEVGFQSKSTPFENCFFLDASQQDPDFWEFKKSLDSAFATNDTSLLFSLLADSLEGVISNQPYVISKYEFRSYGLKADNSYFTPMEFFKEHLQFGFMPIRNVDTVYVRFRYNVLDKYDTISGFKNYPLKKAAFPHWGKGNFHERFPYLIVKDSVFIHEKNSYKSRILDTIGCRTACVNEHHYCGGDMLSYWPNETENSIWYHIYYNGKAGFVNNDDVTTYLDYLTLIYVLKTGEGWKIKSINKAPGC